MESITGLKLMEDRQTGGVLQQAEMFKRLTGHPMHERIKGDGKSRLKRTNFVALAKGEISKHEVLASPTTVSLTANVSTPSWKRTELPKLIWDIPGIVDKQLQISAERKIIAVKYITDNFPRAQWTHAYTGGSAKKATENGGGGVYIQLIHKVHTISVATGKYCNNYKVEASVLVHAAKALREHISDARDKVVIFTDALSVVTTLKNHRPTDLGDLIDQLEGFTKSYQKVVIQWEKDHPSHQKGDAFHQLPRHAQVTILRLRTGHNRLRHHMYHKFKVRDSDMCTCGTASMTAQHVLQECPSDNSERTEAWEQAVTLQDKLYGDAVNLKLTTSFF
jgi:ribonuclease HI